MEKNAKKLVSSAEKMSGSRRLTENYAALKSLAESEEARALISGMNSEDLASLGSVNGKNAASELKRILSTPEGRALVKKIAGITGIK